MAQLKLPKQSDQKPIDITIRLTGDLRRALDRYAALYRASYDEEISVPDLIPAILSEFLASDAEFETGTAGGPAQSRAKVEEPPEPIKPLTDTPERMIQLREVMQLIGLGKTMVYRMIQENRFALERGRGSRVDRKPQGSDQLAPSVALMALATSSAVTEPI